MLQKLPLPAAALHYPSGGTLKKEEGVSKCKF